MDALLRRALDGDEDARDELVRGHAAALRAYLDRRTGAQLARACSVSDLSQEVFVRVFRALESLPEDADGGTFRRFLFRNADWVLATRGRHARGHVGESQVSPVALDPHDRDASLSTGDVTRRDQVAWLHQLVERLEPAYADVVRLRLEGRSHAEIAEALGLKEPTVRQRLSRVTRTLEELHRGGEGS